MPGSAASPPGLAAFPPTPFCLGQESPPPALARRRSRLRAYNSTDTTHAQSTQAHIQSTLRRHKHRRGTQTTQTKLEGQTVTPQTASRPASDFGRHFILVPLAHMPVQTHADSQHRLSRLGIVRVNTRAPTVLNPRILSFARTSVHDTHAGWSQPLYIYAQASTQSVLKLDRLTGNARHVPPLVKKSFPSSGGSSSAGNSGAAA